MTEQTASAVAASPAAPGGQTFTAMPMQEATHFGESAQAAAASPSAAQSQEKAAEDSALPKTAAAIPDQTPTMSRVQMDDLWHQIFEEGEGSASSFNLIRSGTTLGNVGESQFTVLAKTGFAQRYAEKMRPELEHLMERHLGRHLKMVCRRESEEQKKEADSQFENLAKMASETLGIHVEIE